MRRSIRRPKDGARQSTTHHLSRTVPRSLSVPLTRFCFISLSPSARKEGETIARNSRYTLNARRRAGSEPRAFSEKNTVERKSSYGVCTSRISVYSSIYARILLLLPTTLFLLHLLLSLLHHEFPLPVAIPPLLLLTTSCVRYFWQASCYASYVCADQV